MERLLLIGAQWLALSAGIGAPPAAGQTATPPADVPRVQVGSGVGVGTHIGGGPGRVFDVSARFNLTRRTGVGLTLYVPRGGAALYVIDARWTAHRSDRLLTPFVSVGTLGSFRFSSSQGSTRVLRSTGDTVIYPPYAYLHISDPIAVALGGGFLLPATIPLNAECAGQMWLGEGVVMFVGELRFGFGFGKARR